MEPTLFQSFFIGGFESSCHRIRSGQRLDLVAATQHDHYALEDYRRLQSQGITTVREGIRWHLIETRPYRYHFASVLPIIAAARTTGMQVLWDLCHYGWPDDLNLFSPAFIRRFRHFAAAFTRLLINETGETPFLAPVNEISFFAWSAGDMGYMYPFGRDRGFELKLQLVRATIEAIEAIWAVQPAARILHVDPVINIVAHPKRPQDQLAAANYSAAQYQAWDMIAGRAWPALGGHEKYLDIIGVNYYSVNQWIHNSRPISRYHRLYRPFRTMLAEVHKRYGRPLFIAETAIEGDARSHWLRYVAGEVRAAMRAGVPVAGLCLYPILDYPGWDDGRYCPTGLWGYADERGNRSIHQPLADELQRQRRLFAKVPYPQERAMPISTTSRPVAPAKARQPLTVCLFTDSREPSGLGQHMLTLAAELVPQHRLLFVCPSTARGRQLLEQAESLGCATLALDPHDEEQSYDALAVTLQRLDVTLFHCHAGIGWEGHRGVQIAHRQGVPAIIRTEHLPYLLTDPRQQAAYRDQLACVDQVICVSAEALSSYVRAGVPRSKLTLIRNGIRPPEVVAQRAAVCAEFALPPDAHLIFTAARFTEQKGHRHLLAALPDVVAQCPRAYFLWAGEGPLEQELRQRRQALGKQRQHLLLPGWREDAHRLLAAADLFVLPSLFEGLPLVVLEAMALGVPVIGTAVCGTAETVVDGLSGRLVPPGDSAALAAAICEGLTQPGLAAGWSAAGRARYQELFSAERMGCETAALYEAIATRPNVERHQVSARDQVSDRNTNCP